MSAWVASITALCPTLCIRTVLSALLASACGILTRLPVRYDSGSHFTDEKTEVRFRLKSSPKLPSEDPGRRGAAARLCTVNLTACFLRQARSEGRGVQTEGGCDGRRAPPRGCPAPGADSSVQRTGRAGGAAERDSAAAEGRTEGRPRTPHLELRGPRPRRERSRDGWASPPLLKRVLTAAPRWQSAVPILPRRLPTWGAACALGTRGSAPLRRSSDGSTRPRSPAWAPAPHAPSALSGFSSLRGSVWPHLNTR